MGDLGSRYLSQNPVEGSSHTLSWASVSASLPFPDKRGHQHISLRQPSIPPAGAESSQGRSQEAPGTVLRFSRGPSLLLLVLLPPQMKREDLQISFPPNPGQKISPRHLVFQCTDSRAKPMQHLLGIYLQNYQDSPEHDYTVILSNTEN